MYSISCQMHQLMPCIIVWIIMGITSQLELPCPFRDNVFQWSLLPHPAAINQRKRNQETTVIRSTLNSVQVYSLGLTRKVFLGLHQK